MDVIHERKSEEEAGIQEEHFKGSFFDKLKDTDPFGRAYRNAHSHTITFKSRNVNWRIIYLYFLTL